MSLYLQVSLIIGYRAKTLHCFLLLSVYILFLSKSIFHFDY